MKGLACLIALALGLSGCLLLGGQGGPFTAPQGGYQPGEVRYAAEAFGFLEEKETGVDVLISLRPADRVFVQDPGGGAFVSTLEVDLTLSDARQQAVASGSVVDALRVPTYGATQSFLPSLIHHRMTAPAGTYRLDITLRDAATEKATRRRLSVEVPGRSPWLSPVQLHGYWREGGRRAVIGRTLAAGYDTLQTQVTVIPRTGGGQVAMQLVRLRSDTTIATPPYGFSLLQGALAYRGVIDTDAETVQRAVRSIGPGASPVDVVFQVPPLDEGVYQMVVEYNGGETTRLHQSRLFVVLPPASPYLTTHGALAEALAYLTSPRAYRDLMASAPSAIRARFEAFWRDRMPDEATAAATMARYYARVEEANILFSAHKAGWKTDRGMVYIIMGPPNYTEPRLDQEVWYYRYGSAEAPDAFTFERVVHDAGGDWWENYVLERNPAYLQPWQRQVERWRRGAVR